MNANGQQSENMYRERSRPASTCEIVSVGKRRDGGTRYWCLTHGANATAKYGQRATACHGAHIPMITDRDTLDLHLDGYSGGVALWGAVPPVYDTTEKALDRGIHVHARKTLAVINCSTKPSALCASYRAQTKGKVERPASSA